MGCNMKDKSSRGHRKSRNNSIKHQSHPLSTTINAVAADDDSSSKISSSKVSSSAHAVPGSTVNIIDNNYNPSSPYFGGFDEAAVAEISGGYWTEEQLEDLLIRNMDLVYKEALSKLASVGYDEDVALRAVLRNGHCYGSMDVLNNIVHNAVSYINSSAAISDDSDDGSSCSPAALVGNDSTSFAFSDLRHLQEYSLAGMVCFLQEMRPDLTRGDALWCLLMSDLNVSRARTIDIPVLPPLAPPTSVSSSIVSLGDGGGGGEFSCSVPYGICRFHEECVGEKEIECSKRFNLSPSMKAFLKRNAIMSSAGIRLNSKMSLPGPNVRQDISGSQSSSTNQKQQQMLHEDDIAGKESDVVASVLKGLENMSLEEEGKAHDGTEDHKKEMIMGLIHQIQDLEEQVKERKEWAQQKAIQAARKLSSDMTELKILRMERDENQRLKKGKQTLEDSTMKKLSEMENALRKASGQVDRANALVRQLEAENAEIKAEMEASKLSAAESVTACLEVTKREKKCLKRLLAWEKQKEKLQKEIADEKKKISQIQQKLNQVNEAQKGVEEKWRQEVRAKEEAILLLEEERRIKEAAEMRIKRSHEALQQKIDMDFQRYKDDMQRLQEELSRLKASADSTPSNCVSSNIPSVIGRDGTKSSSQKQETTKNISLGSYKLQESSQKRISSGWKCVICMKDEVSVVLLPCAHQVLCFSCNEDHEKRSKACPCCSIQIEERIRVFGASS